MNVVVFLGPSLDVPSARSILPEAIYLPPAGQADLVSAVYRHRPRVIALVDGYFNQRFAVWHKEILHALEKGVHVFGASSMGALRAAELDTFGMVGVGEVYRRFAAGELDADDEVALAHGDESSGYVPLSVPLVNIRATIEDAVAAGVVDAGDARRFVAVAQSVHFADRTISAIAERAAEHLATGSIETIARFLAERPRDVKREDAIALLETLAALPDDLGPKQIDFEVQRPPVMTALLERDRVFDHDGVALTHAELAYHAALNMTDFNQFNFDTLNRLAAVVLARRLGLAVEQSDIDDETRRLRLRHRLTDDDAFARWLESNHLDADELGELMEEVALCRRLHRWLLVRRHHAGTARPIVDSMRLAGSYTNWADSFADQQRFVTDDIYEATKASALAEPLRDLVVEHLRAAPCRMDTHHAVWAWEAGFADERTLRVELLRARQARRNRRQLVAQLGALLAGAESPIREAPAEA